MANRNIRHQKYMPVRNKYHQNKNTPKTKRTQVNSVFNRSIIIIGMYVSVCVPQFNPLEGLFCFTHNHETVQCNSVPNHKKDTSKSALGFTMYQHKIKSNKEITEIPASVFTV